MTVIKLKRRRSFTSFWKDVEAQDADFAALFRYRPLDLLELLVSHMQHCAEVWL